MLIFPPPPSVLGWDPDGRNQSLLSRKRFYFTNDVDEWVEKLSINFVEGPKLEQTACMAEFKIILIEWKREQK